MNQLKIVIVGHVDHGKSTLIGRLFYDTGMLPEGRYEQLVAAAQRRGMPFEWANLMDGLQAERDQNITIDTAQIWFRTRSRQCVIIDAPGHKEFLKNMVTGAASAEAALLVIAANEGLQEQTRRHAALLEILGLRQVAVLVNKMDLVDFREDEFRRVSEEAAGFLKTLSISPVCIIPISARQGENVAERGERMSWYEGPTVLEALDAFHNLASPEDRPLRFVVQDIYRFDDRRVLAGRVESGVLRVGDRLLFSPRDKRSLVKSIERWACPPASEARAGESVGILLEEQIFVERGHIGSHEDHPPIETDVFNARLFWLGKTDLAAGRPYKLKLATQEVECRVQSIEKVIDASTLGESLDRSRVARNNVAEVTLRTKVPVALDNFDLVAPTGRFVLVDGYEISGGGVIANCRYPDRRPQLSGVKSTNIFWSEGKVTRTQREQRAGHRGAVVWLTGLSGSGKSTIGIELERELFGRGMQVFYIDGDNVRHGLSANLGFSPDDRSENIRRVGEVARLFLDAGAIVITAFISPYRNDRQLVRSIIPEGDFIEVFLDSPVEVCEQRDRKGLYKKARAGLIPNFTGVSAPYEKPESPELHLRTDQLTVSESVARIMDHLGSRRPGAPR